jgi:hypothetical protein
MRDVLTDRMRPNRPFKTDLRKRASPTLLGRSMATLRRKEKHHMLELAFKVHGQVIDFWKFFVPSAIALLGWVFARKDPWPWAQRAAVAIAYVGFAVFNLYGLVESYGMLETLVAELRGSKGAPGLTDKAFEAIVSRLDMGRGWKIGIAFHIVVDLIVLYFILIWSGKKHVS